MSSTAVLGAMYASEDRRSNNRLRRVFVIVIAALSLILIMQIVFHLVVAPRMRIRNVEIVSDRHLSLTDEDVLSIAGLKGTTYLFAVDEAAIADRLESYPAIRSVTVRRSFPNTLLINIRRRVPLVISLVEIDGGSVPIVMDRRGVVFEIGTSVTQHDLPVISGLRFADVRLGQRANNALLGFFADLDELRSDDPRLFNLISECKFITKNRAGYEVLLFLHDYPVKVRIGSSIDADLLKRIVLVLDVFKTEGITEQVDEIDLRTDEVVTTFKER